MARLCNSLQLGVNLWTLLLRYIALLRCNCLNLEIIHMDSQGPVQHVCFFVFLWKQDSLQHTTSITLDVNMFVPWNHVESEHMLSESKCKEAQQRSTSQRGSKGSECGESVHMHMHHFYATCCLWGLNRSLSDSAFMVQHLRPSGVWCYKCNSNTFGVVCQSIS